MNSIYELVASNKALTPVINYAPRISPELKSEVTRYLREGYALALELDYVPDSFIVNYRTYQIAALRIGNAVFFTIDDSAYLDFAMAYQAIVTLLGGE